jgi:hypothetical protein
MRAIVKATKDAIDAYSHTPLRAHSDPRFAVFVAAVIVAALSEGPRPSRMAVLGVRMKNFIDATLVVAFFHSV